MGLDITLYTVEQQELNEAYYAKYDEDFDEDALTPEEKAEREVLEEKYWKSNGEDHKSKEFPDNINTRRYLRSSYNDSGFNRVVPNATGNEAFTYEGIFAPLWDSEGYGVGWVDDLDKVAEVRKNAVAAVEALEQLKGKAVRRSMDVTVVNPFNAQIPTTSEDEALALANEQLDKPNPFGGGWSSSEGLFLPDGINVVAVIPGQSIIGALSVHVIYEEPVHESYLESAKVLVEFVDELANLIKKDGRAYISWSG